MAREMQICGITTGGLAHNMRCVGVRAFCAPSCTSRLGQPVVFSGLSYVHAEKIMQAPFLKSIGAKPYGVGQLLGRAKRVGTGVETCWELWVGPG